MAHRIPDRVLESFTGTSGNITTTGAISGHQTLASQLTVNGDTGDFVLAGGTNGAQWEFTRLTRVSATVYSRAAAAAFPGFSSSTGSTITFGAGTLEVHSDIGAFFLRHLNTIEITIADSATPDIGAAHGLAVVLDGTTTITSFGTVAHQWRLIRFSGIRTLTHNATSLILPRGVNITTAAGDTCIARSDGSGNWRVYNYERAVAATAFSDIKQAATTAATGAVQLADAAAMEALTADRAVTADLAHRSPSACKAWAEITPVAGTGAATIAASNNITSVNDGGVGVFTFTIATDFSSASYAALITCFGTLARIAQGSASQAAGSIGAAVFDAAGVAADPTILYIACFGDQA